MKELDPLEVNALSRTLLEMIAAAKLGAQREVLVAALRLTATAIDETTNAQLNSYSRARIISLWLPK